jgi:hypothetical protein
VEFQQSKKKLVLRHLFYVFFLGMNSTIDRMTVRWSMLSCEGKKIGQIGPPQLKMEMVQHSHRECGFPRCEFPYSSNCWFKFWRVHTIRWNFAGKWEKKIVWPNWKTMEQIQVVGHFHLPHFPSSIFTCQSVFPASHFLFAHPPLFWQFISPSSMFLPAAPILSICA